MTLTTPIPVARPATHDDRDEIARVLTAGFLDDPVFAWITPSRPAREAILPALFTTFRQVFDRHGAIETAAWGGDRLSGVALWAPPGVEPVHPDDESLFEEGLSVLSSADRARWDTCLAVFGDAHPTEPVWYLNLLAVEPSSQGRGIGSTLLTSVLSRADAANEAAYLEATTARNRALYERHGFRCVRELPLPGGPTTYAMWRDPT